MNRHQWLTGVLGLASLAIAVWLVAPARTVSFDKLADACDGIRAHGFHCRSDYQDGNVHGSGFMVSRQPATWQEANRLFKNGTMSAAWRGKVWVTDLDPELSYFLPDDASVRYWGRICAFGDEELLAEMEAALQQRTPVNLACLVRLL
jgi:hypothetical protein